MLLVTRAIGQKKGEQQAIPLQNKHPQHNRQEEQRQQQSWNGDYTYEETADRDWLEEQLLKYDNRTRAEHRSWSEDHTFEETVDRNWLAEHNLD
jgi:hypothetical protein